MDNLLRQVTIILRAMWRYRWLGIITSWVVAVLGIVVVVVIPEKYEASARVYVNTDSILKPLMAGMTVQPDIDQRIAMLSRVLISRPNVEQLVNLTGLDAKAKSRLDRDDVVDKVTKLLDIKASGKENLYTVTFRDESPERAKRAVETLVSMFIESGQGGKSRDSDAAKKFIEDQVAIYEKKLEEAENRLKEFKLRNLTGGSEGGKDYFARMSEAQTMLNQAQLELREAENSRDAFKRGLASEEPAPTAAPAAAVATESIADLDARIDALRRNLDLLLQRYTDQHPDVLGTRRAVRELEEQRKQVIAERKKAGIPIYQANPGNGPRAYEQLKVSLAESEAKVAVLRARVAEFGSRLARLKESARMMPQIEAEYAQLNRDYEVNKKNYESLVARRESANISGEMQAVSGVGDFRLIDPPRVSPRPVTPNRLVLMALSLIVTLGAGFGIAFLAVEIKPTFFDAITLREVVGLPILGTVSLVADTAHTQTQKRIRRRFMSVAGLLLGVYVVAFGVLAYLHVKAM